MPKILISNDDGIYGLGLKPLIRELRKLGQIVVVVPDGERSAASHSITLHKPFRVQLLQVELSRNDVVHVNIANGTPSDCVRFGVLEILKDKKVDLVVGGINAGPNMGEDTAYSGTVAVAREGAMLGIPSMAVSIVHSSRTNFEGAAKVAGRIARQLLENKLPSRIFLNVNLPGKVHPDTSIQITRLGRRIYGKAIASGIDPRGQQYYWLAGQVPQGIYDRGTDLAALKARKISITPLSVDSTELSFISELSRWQF